MQKPAETNLARQVVEGVEALYHGAPPLVQGLVLLALFAGFLVLAAWGCSLAAAGAANDPTYR